MTGWEKARHHSRIAFALIILRLVIWILPRPENSRLAEFVLPWLVEIKSSDEKEIGVKNDLPS
jgi:hypothetical protein